MIILSPRAAFIRNAIVSGVSGTITLVILLIAPLGLVAVMTNTLLVTCACYFTNSIADRIIYYLEPKNDRFSINPADRNTLVPPAQKNIDRRS